LVFSLTGCCEPKPCKPIIKTEYIDRPIPNIENKPEAMKYDVKVMQIDGIDYYVIEKSQGTIMSSNWSNYKTWCSTNYQILKNLDTNNSK
jgi:hypothetical protein